ncbi:MAG: glycosyltransferase [Caldilineaceae bacterium]
MRLVYITPGYTQSNHRKGQYLADNGFVVKQVTSSQQYHASVLKTQITPNHELHPVPIIWPGNPHKGFLLSGLSWVRTFKPDLIAIERDPDTFMALQLAAIRRLWAPQAKLVFHSWQNVARPLKVHVRLVLAQTLRAADCILYANLEGEQILRSWGYTGALINQIWMGVDTTIFQPQNDASLRQRLMLADKFVIGYVGRLAAEKGIEDLLHALPHLPDQVHCVLLGQGEMKSRLIQQVQALGIASRVHFVGNIPHTELATYLSMMNVMVLPSHTTTVWKEQFGRVLIEAMACGTPVVGSDSGAIPEVIGNAGLVFPEGDVGALVDCLRQLINSTAIRQQLAANGLCRVESEFAQSEVSRRVAQCYSQIIQTGRPEQKNI